MTFTDEICKALMPSSNAMAAVEYHYAADGLDAGYSLTLHNGSVFARSVARDGLRRSLVTGIVNTFNGNAVESIAYSYDALGRPVARNADAFGYNERGEVTSASIMGWSQSPARASYGYDGIGNLQQSTFNAATNAYTANCLNQYTSILRASAPLREIKTGPAVATISSLPRFCNFWRLRGGVETSLIICYDSFPTTNARRRENR